MSDTDRKSGSNSTPSDSPTSANGAGTHRNSFWRRTKMVSFRVSDAEFERLRQQSQANGARSVSEFARLALVGRSADPPEDGGQPVERLQAEVKQLGDEVSSLWKLLQQARADQNLPAAQPQTPRARRKGA